MSESGEAETATMPVEQPAPEKPAKPVKEKKAKTPKVPKEKKPKSAKASHAHPPYFDMIKEALLALSEKSGSSPYAIAKYMEENHKAVLPPNFRKMLGLQLKNSAAKGKLIKIKASYKLSEAGKKGNVSKPTSAKAADADKKKRKNPEKPKAAAASGKSKVAKKAGTTPKKAAKKPTKKGGMKKTRKATPAKPKQPKSIKSPAKKAKRA